ncbi:hypothetical protein BDQ94DRAFT_136985 [Aspergillus welwitschiae]|uniref:Uncharacterized protein n=1 Tax=Aspergillus welwitschiae TaxID=1341132 RepID=A0A3F3QCE9_9EURO|nr:hypothetical protein BDQ94DRAFT_136985 [Aspergillus welwitschiae]RDH36858.1 hypothetical protein BDQ94DRAFT_136985 [Aspergillus welwitschiae]
MCLCQLCLGTATMGGDGGPRASMTSTFIQGSSAASSRDRVMMSTLPPVRCDGRCTFCHIRLRSPGSGVRFETF